VALGDEARTFAKLACELTTPHPSPPVHQTAMYAHVKVQLVRDQATTVVHDVFVVEAEI
jgi:hypothetical protein